MYENGAKDLEQKFSKRSEKANKFTEAGAATSSKPKDCTEKKQGKQRS